MPHTADMVQDSCQRAPSLSHTTWAGPKSPPLTWFLESIVCLPGMYTSVVVFSSITRTLAGIYTFAGVQVFVKAQVLVSSGVHTSMYVLSSVQVLVSKVPSVTSPSPTQGQIVPKAKLGHNLAKHLHTAAALPRRGYDDVEVRQRPPAD